MTWHFIVFTDLLDSGFVCICFCFYSIRKALDSIIRGLDAQVGRPVMMTNPHCSHKEADDMITWVQTDLL